MTVIINLIRSENALIKLVTIQYDLARLSVLFEDPPNNEVAYLFLVVVALDDLFYCEAMPKCEYANLKHITLKAGLPWQTNISKPVRIYQFSSEFIAVNHLDKCLFQAFSGLEFVKLGEF